MLTPNHKTRFQQLLTMLSPENISHDGERTHEEVVAARFAIEQEWAQLEARAGRRVSKAEVSGWAYKR